MTTLDLRPLSLGELLDRTFFLYRRHFFLFIGIAAIPYSLFFVFSLGSVLYTRFRILPQFPGSSTPLPSAGFSSDVIAGFVIVSSVAIVAFLFSVGASVSAVSAIYLGRSTTIVESLRRATARFFPMLGVSFLSLLISIGGLILLVIPAFYLMCRISAAIAATVLEDIGAFAAIGRSFNLTKGFAGRAFLIYLLIFALAIGLGGALQLPFGILIAIYAKQRSMVTLWLIFLQVGNFIVRVLIAPIGTIGTSLYYYDLRVRKEAFDLQMMMQAIGGAPIAPQVTGGVPSMFGRDAS